jgi:integration host factor subunit beta
MTKRDIIAELLVRRPSLALHESELMVNALFQAMAEVLAHGERIELRGFGSFGIKQRAARQGRNPKTGASVTVAAKRIPFFRAGKELQLEVNSAAANAPEQSS